MKNTLKKIVQTTISERVLAILALLAFAALMLPLARLACYAAPWYDDYIYSRHVKSFLAQEYSLKSALAGARYVAETWRYCWQGTFSSAFMMALMPAVFGEQYYVIGIWGILFVFVLGSFCFVKVSAKHVLKAERSAQVIMMVVVTAAMLELIYTAQQGIYWYNAAVHYTFMHGCLFLLLAAAIKLLYSRKLMWAVLWMLPVAALAFVCGGSNYVTSLQGLLALLTLAALGVMARNKKSLLLLPPALVYGAALYYNVSAPGNLVRGAYYQGYGIVKSILYSFKSAACNFWTFTGVITVLVLLLLAPCAWNTVRKLDFCFRLPGLVTLYSVCFYATGFTSSYYGMGYEGLSRTWVVVKFTLQILLFINEIYWLGWFAKRREKKGKEVRDFGHRWWYYLAVAAGVYLCFSASSNPIGNYSSFGAYYYVHSGEAANFHGEYLERVETIKNGGSVVEVKPYVWRPWFLCNRDLGTDPNEEANRSMAEWYGKEAIYIAE